MTNPRLSEAEAKKPLDRASELDAERAQSLDPAALREIAIEAGISPAAIDAAVEEHLPKRETIVKTRPRFSLVIATVRVVSVLLLAYVVLRLLFE